MFFTNEDKLREIKREIAMRRRLYGRYVSEGRMKQEHADHSIDIMEAIAHDYAELVATERLL